MKNRLSSILSIVCLLAITGCVSVTEFWQRDSTQAIAHKALQVAESEALNIGLNALAQYANGGGNINWGVAALSAAPIALRTLESTPAASNESDISATVAASIAEWRLHRDVSTQTAAAIAKALQTPGVTPDQAVEAVAVGLDAAVATTPDAP